MDSNEILLLNQEPEPLSVSIICHLITKTIKPLLNDIQIIGEIGEYKVNEHVYFRLYDPNITDKTKSVFLEMVIWKRQWYEIQQKLPRNFQLDKGKKSLSQEHYLFFKENYVVKLKHWNLQKKDDYILNICNYVKN
jgi:exonuclease VII large subunit